MISSRSLIFAAATALSVASHAAVPPQHAQDMAKGLALFKSDVRAALTQHCLKCHGGEKVKGGLDLATREGLLKGGEEGPSIVLGQSKSSVLYKLITHQSKPAMPDKSPKLLEPLIAKIAQWIDLGAPYDKPLVETGTVSAGRGVTEADRQFWSFQPLKKSTAPKVKDTKWPRNDIDRHILAKLEEKKIAPNNAADRRTLLRRVSLDLTGLPPTPAEVEAFVKDSAPDAFAKVVDRLLASPHYGERWGRHWLDLARFAESHGFEQDYDRPHAYHFRDFVIKALNADMPYDQFVKWQIAGDELAPKEPLALMATGFLGAGVFPTQLTEKEFESARYDELDDMAGTLGTAMLGLTIGCARCHDHKFDPIPVRDYYRLVSTFSTTIRSEIQLDIDPVAHKASLAKWEKEHAPFAEALAKFEREQIPARFAQWATNSPVSVKGQEALFVALKKAGSPEKLDEKSRAKLLDLFKTQDAEWKKRNDPAQKSLVAQPKPPKVQVTSEGVKPMKHHADDRGFPHFYKETHFLKRGDANQKQDVVTQSFLQVLMRGGKTETAWKSAPPEGAQTSHRRAGLANWISDTEHGAGHLLARVIVNRLWQHHFGRGLVGTPSDFGAQGERPTHPELLDFLASELIKNGWRLKSLHKLILTSATYEQDAKFDDTKAAKDPQNTLVWRHAPQRLEAEAIRDSILSVSGRLDRTMFGLGTLNEASTRRSVYFFIKRSKLVSAMQLFDAPEPLVGQAARPATVIAPQALLFMNSPQVRLAAKELAATLQKTSSALDAAVPAAYMAALSRAPAKDEMAKAVAFVQAQEAAYKTAGRADAAQLALADFCQALFGLNEFVYVE